MMLPKRSFQGSQPMSPWLWIHCITHDARQPIGGSFATVLQGSPRCSRGGAGRLDIGEYPLGHCNQEFCCRFMTQCATHTEIFDGWWVGESLLTHARQRPSKLGLTSTKVRDHWYLEPAGLLDSRIAWFHCQIREIDSTRSYNLL